MDYDALPNTPNSSKKFYYFMPCCTVIYLKDGEPKQRILNVVVQISDREFNYPAINQARHGCLQRVSQENGIAPEDIRDFVINSINSLGLMSQDEFEGNQPKTKKSQRN